MSNELGRKGHLFMFFEDTFAENPAEINAFKVPFITSEIQAKQSFVQEEVIRNSRNPLPSGRGFVDVSGSIAVPVDEVGMGFWFKAMFGNPTTTEITPGILYSHVWKLLDELHSLGLEQGFNGKSKYFLYNGCKVSKIAIELGGEGNLNATIDIAGAKETSGDISVDIDPTVIPLYRFNNFQGMIKEGGVTIAIVTKATLDIDFDLETGEETYPIGSGGYRTNIPEGIAKITGTLTTFFEDDDLLTKGSNGTETSLELGLVKGDKELSFYMPQIQLERTSPSISGGKGVMLEFNYEAYENGNAEGTALVVTLKNEQETY